MNQLTRNKRKPWNQRVEESRQVADTIATRINNLNGGLRNYRTRDLVTDAELLGTVLAEVDLKTNQIRKFLDAVKQLKTQQRVQNAEIVTKKEGSTQRELSSTVISNIPLLRPKIAYAAAKQRTRDFGPVDPLETVLIAAIKKVERENSLEDLNRLSQLIESIVAYHKAAGGKDQ